MTSTDRVYEKADRLARRAKEESGSQLRANAIAEYVERRDCEAVTEAMNRVCKRLGARPESALSAAGRRVLQRTEW